MKLYHLPMILGILLLATQAYANFGMNKFGISRFGMEEQLITGGGFSDVPASSSTLDNARLTDDGGYRITDDGGYRIVSP